MDKPRKLAGRHLVVLAPVRLIVGNPQADVCNMLVPAGCNDFAGLPAQGAAGLMKIIDNRHQSEQKTEVLIKLRDLIAQPSDTQARPCPDCSIRFGEETLLSAENCSSACKYAPRHMSGEPDKFPIEAGSVPLVYALYSLRLITPCWSCEGHLNADGGIGKLPKVWFYSGSRFYPKMIAQVIGQLQAHHKIGYSCGVKVLPFSQSLFSTTYSIEAQASDVRLGELQKDIITLGKVMRQEMLSLANDYVRRGGKES